MSNGVSQVGIKSILFLILLPFFLYFPFLSPPRTVVFLLYGLGQRFLYGNTYKKVFDRSWEVVNEFTFRSDNSSFWGERKKINISHPNGRKNRWMIYWEEFKYRINLNQNRISDVYTDQWKSTSPSPSSWFGYSRYNVFLVTKRLWHPFRIPVGNAKHISLSLFACWKRC